MLIFFKCGIITVYLNIKNTMNKKAIFSVATSTLVATLAVVGVTYASTPASNDTSFLNKGTVEVDSLKVGKQDTGGVTFFNGTIVNSTTSGGADNPVTFGDNVRIDGRVYRGDNAGPALGDSKPFILNDDVQVAGSLEVGGTDIFAVKTKKHSIPGSAFRPVDTFSEGGAIYSGAMLIPTPQSGANYANYTAPLQLPDGSKITKVTLRAKDNDAASGGHLHLGVDRAASLGQSNIQGLALTFFTTDNSGSTSNNFQDYVESGFANDQVVDNSYAYTVNIVNRSAASNTSVSSFNTAVEQVVVEYEHSAL